MANSAVGKRRQSEESRRWIWGVGYIITVAVIWVIASFVVQEVVNQGVSPFLITYICNALFIVYIPLVEGRRYLERAFKEQHFPFWKRRSLGYTTLTHAGEKITEMLPLQAGILENVEATEIARLENFDEPEVQQGESGELGTGEKLSEEAHLANILEGVVGKDEPWSRKRTALVVLTIGPLWFFAQFTFNLSLKYTTVTSNTILSTTSTMFTFLFSLKFLGERFTWLKLASVTLCMGGTIIVSLGDSWKREGGETARNAFWGDVICLLSAVFYAVYTALIRAKIPEEDHVKGRVSFALVFGYLGLFNALLLAPVALLLHFTGVEPFHRLTPGEVGLIVLKGLFDNVMSDYLWARAVLLTSPTAATAGLAIQVPMAAGFEAIRGDVPTWMDGLGAIAVLVGFFGINQPDPKPGSSSVEEENGNGDW